ncbi:hypothetical protein [Phascolarctobacterium succinatutens]|nr:hypothetical protein [Phascolarctobacterium succinatutens]
MLLESRILRCTSASGVRLLSELTAGVKKSFTGTAKDTLHL